MIYTKTRLSSGEVVKTAVTDTNTYTRCAVCGKEIRISLNDPVVAKANNPFALDMLCSDCTENLMYVKGMSPAENDGKFVYICSPYAGDVELNTKAAAVYCRNAVKKGYIPIAPHLLFTQFLNDNDPGERKLGMTFGKRLMDICSEFWVCGTRISAGMKEELAHAQKAGMTVRFMQEG